MGAADIGVMGQIADEAQEHVIDENRRRERHIGQVRAAAFVRVVGHEDIAGRDLGNRIFGQ